MELLQPSDLAVPKGPFSPGVAAGSFIFVAGQVPVDQDGQLVGPGDVGAQTEQVLKNMASVLASAGATLDDVVSVTSYLTDLSGTPDYNQAYSRAFGDHRPARATVRAELVDPRYLVEITAVAIDPRAS